MAEEENVSALGDAAFEENVEEEENVVDDVTEENGGNAEGNSEENVGNLEDDLFGDDADEEPEETPAENAEEAVEEDVPMEDAGEGMEAEKVEEEEEKNELLFYGIEHVQEGRELSLLKVPGIPVDEKKFVKEKFLAEVDQRLEEMKRAEEEGAENVKALKARERNLQAAALRTIRWRMGEDEKVESNARLVCWEDGTWQLLVGDKAFDISKETMSRNVQQVHMLALINGQMQGEGRFGNTLTVENVVADAEEEPLAKKARREKKEMRFLMEMSGELSEAAKRRELERDSRRLIEESNRVNERRHRTHLSADSLHDGFEDRYDRDYSDDSDEDDSRENRLKKAKSGRR